MISEIAVSAHDLSKCYRLYAHPQDRLKQTLFGDGRFGGARKYYEEFWALRSVNFEIPRGSSVGIVGRNGAGKSTLLQIIAGTLNPTNGTVSRSGRIAALLELGTGFNPEFTGRENVFLNASLFGLSHRETAEKFDSICAFADIGNFIEQPVKTYSSGMFVRLAFAIVVHVDADILIIDEALAVGDAKFQAKCFRKLEEFHDRGGTLLFVTHSVETMVRHCERALLVDAGRILADGPAASVANKYLDLLFGVAPQEQTSDSRSSIGENVAAQDMRDTPGSATASDDVSSNATLQTFTESAPSKDLCCSRPGFNKSEYRWGSRECEILDYLVGTESRWHTNRLDSSETLKIGVKVRFLRDIQKPIFGLTIKTPDGVTVYGSNSRDWAPDPTFVSKKKGQFASVLFLVPPNLVTGSYFLSLGVAEERDGAIIPLDRRYDAIEIHVTNRGKSFGLVDLGMKVQQLA